MTDYSVLRDRWGRPLLYPRDDLSYELYRQHKAAGVIEREPYTRASTMAKALDDQSGLIGWAKAMVAIGLVKERSLGARVASLLSRDGANAYANNKTALRDITEKAMTAAGSGRAADSGTAFHEFTEIIDDGGWPEYMPYEAEGPMRAYADLMQKARARVLDKEPFLTVDEIRVAGSMDKLLNVDGMVMGGDVKSGVNNSKYPLGVTCQCAIYAHGERYNPETDERSPLHPDIDLKQAVLIEIPREKNKYGKFEAAMYLLDIDYGWDAVQLALDVREARKIPKLKRIA
ncbi:hypothetical protein [Nocardia transvalensis]|uniref:hypothetical protein n=1 Tax=Nocardia transvalensis TaxID=37333 RepID=UPI001895A29C|nr:hypothetical protein [Nocardia transvalensis]MBF6330837.1 hypothetical protein [Nocardia transvalensis]